MELRKVSPTDSAVTPLITLLNDHHLKLCGDNRCHLTRPDELATCESVMLGAYIDDELIAIGAVKIFSDYGEITRMFVKDKHRGKGLARKILTHLLEILIQRRIPYARLETAIEFEKAVKLYKEFGFQKCGPFGEYVKHPVNMYMEKILLPI